MTRAFSNVDCNFTRSLSDIFSHHCSVRYEMTWGTSSKSGTDISLPCSLTFKNISLHGSSPPNSYLRIIYWFIYFEGRSQWPRCRRSRFAAARLLGLRFRIPWAAWMPVCCVYCVLSGRDLCDVPIPRPEYFYRVRVSLYDRETLMMREDPAPLEAVAPWGQNYFDVKFQYSWSITDSFRLYLLHT